MSPRSLAPGAVIRTGVATSVAVLALAIFGTASAAASFTASGSAEQVYVTGLSANARMALLKPQAARVATQSADSLGGSAVPQRPTGSGYRVRRGRGRRVGADHRAQRRGRPMGPEHLQPDDPRQRLRLPDDPRRDEARDRRPPTRRARPGVLPGVTLPVGDYAPPYPTLIEYSGYGYADPGGPDSGIAVLANLMGFAVVDVNMRGTGCSGGAFDYFEPLQNLDGYDVIETIAHQPWVLGHKVGMMGISYGAISQLFTAQLDPPDLEAISPLSTIDATATTLYPGGILNTGFAVAWAEQRQQQAQPAGPNGNASRTPASRSRRAIRPASRTRCCTARRATC